jgi:hypothetical protein
MIKNGVTRAANAVQTANRELKPFRRAAAGAVVHLVAIS